MKNITLKIDDDTYRRARILAAQRNTSLSAMVREFLLQQLSGESDPDRRRIEALDELYRIAEQRMKSRKKPLKPLTREEIYAERLR